MADKRVEKTLGLIKKTFFEITKTNGRSNPTVKEICEAANINRSTFYQYYDGIDDLRDKLETEAANKMHEVFLTYKFDTYTEETIIAQLTRIKEHDDEAFLLFGENSSQKGIHILYEKVKESTIPEWRKVSDSDFDDFTAEIIFNYTMAGIFALLKEWYLHYDDNEKEAFAKVYGDVLKYGLYYFVYTKNLASADKGRDDPGLLKLND